MRFLLCVPGGAVRVHKQPRDNWKIITKIIVFLVNFALHKC